jgi:hypothetical protein
MTFLLRASIHTAKGRGVDLLASQTFKGRYMGPLESDAMDWCKDQHNMIEDAIAETGEPVIVTLSWTREEVSGVQLAEWAERIPA